MQRWNKEELKQLRGIKITDTAGIEAVAKKLGVSFDRVYKRVHYNKHGAKKGTAKAVQEKSGRISVSDTEIKVRGYKAVTLQKDKLIIVL